MKVSEGFAMADSRNLPQVDSIMMLEHMHRSDVYNAAEVRGAKLLTRDAYVDTAVGYVEVHRSQSICTVKARVTPEHKVRSKMYTVIAKIDEDEEKIDDLSCEDCAAAAGGCKHGICVLHWLIKRTSEPSVTSTQCYWKKPLLGAAVMSDQPLPSVTLGKKRDFEKLKTTVTLKSIIVECKQQKLTGSLLCNYSEVRKTTLDDFSAFKLMLQCYNNLNVDFDYNVFVAFCTKTLLSENIDKIEKATNAQVNSKLWHSMRQYRVTASTIHDASRCRTNGALVQSIMGGYKVPETKAMQRGKRLEADVKKQLSSDLDVVINNCGLTLVSPIIGASPDGIAVGKDYVVEIKCPTKESTMKNYLTKDNNIKEKFKAQVMLQMHAARKQRGLFCVADPNFESNHKYTMVWVDYDKAYVNKLIVEAEAFWKQCIFEHVKQCVK